MDHASFLKAAEQGQTPLVTLLHGSEPFLLHDAVTLLTRALFPDPAQTALDREVLDARDVGAEAIVRSALTLPWGSKRRLVVAREADALGSRQGEALAAYVKAPSPSTALVLVVDHLLDPGHWLLKAIPPAAVVALPKLTGQGLVAWLRTRAAAEEIELGQEAAELLVELSGEDASTLVGEVEKAALAGDETSRRVTVNEVRAVVGEQRLRKIFDLTRALREGDVGPALAVLESLLNAGEKPEAVVAMLGREARTTRQIREWLRLGQSAETINRRLRRPPSIAAALVQHARSLSPGTADRHLARCWEVERRLKLGSLGRPELSILITDLCAR